MLRVESVVESRNDPGLHEVIHHLEHHNAVEFVTVAVGDLDCRRLMARTDKGEEVAITWTPPETGGALSFVIL